MTLHQIQTAPCMQRAFCVEQSVIPIIIFKYRIKFVHQDTALGHLMADFACKDPDRFYYKELADETRYYKHDEKGVRRMCKIMEDVANVRSKQIALVLIALGKLSLKEIEKCASLPLSEVKELAKKKSA